jgi:DNA-binding transcriptional LysR family regulator
LLSVRARGIDGRNQNRMNDSDLENKEPPFTFRAVQIFVSVVEAESVTKAALRLGISPSSVSQQLASLEAALGTKLILRSARQFQLTRSGETFLASAKQLLDDVGAAKAKLVMADQEPPMALKIASIEELDATITATWLVALTKSFPNISFSLTSGASHDNHDALSTRAVDMMLAVDTVASVDWVEQHPILRDPFILVTAHGQSNPMDLKRPFVRYSNDLLIGRQIDAQLRRTGINPVRGFEFSSNQAFFSMISEIGGWGITTALAFLGTPLATDIVEAHPLPIPQFSRRLALHARAGALGSLPAHIAAQMRMSIQERIKPAVDERLTFIADGFQIIHET